MKKHEFYKKYANTPLGSRHIVSTGTIENGFKDSKSPWELYSEMSELDNVIARAKVRQEEILEVAENVFSPKHQRTV